MKREFENLRRRNQELEGGIQIDEEQLEGLRLALEQEKRKSMGVEEYARRKYQEYERRLQEEQAERGEAERAYHELNRRNQQNAQQLQQVNAQLEEEKRKRKEVATLADRKAKELQSINSQLERQLRDGEGDLQQKSNDLRRIRGEN